MKWKKFDLFVLFLLVISLVCAQEITPPAEVPEIDQFDPGVPDNYDRADFYITVPPSEWDWNIVNWNYVDLSQSEIYGYQGFYDNLPQAKYKKIDYNKVDYNKLDYKKADYRQIDYNKADYTRIIQRKVNPRKFFLDKECQSCVLEKGSFVAGKHFYFRQEGLDHSKGNFVTIPGPYPFDSDFTITEDKIIVNHDRAAAAGEHVEYDTLDTVSVQVDTVEESVVEGGEVETHHTEEGYYILDTRSAPVINGRLLQYGELKTEGGRTYKEEGTLVIIANSRIGGEEVEIFTDGEKHPESESYVSIGNDGYEDDGRVKNPTVYARGKGLGIDVGTSSIGGDLLVNLGEEKGVAGEIDARWDTDSMLGRLWAKGIFHGEEGKWSTKPFSGNGGNFWGESEDSELELSIEYKERGKGRGSFKAKNGVYVGIAGDSYNLNPFANEGGGAMDVFVGDMEVEVDNSRELEQRTMVSFIVPEEKVKGMSAQEKEDFLYKNTRIRTWGASNCDNDGYCDLKSYTNKDFTLMIGYAKYGKGSEKRSNTLFAGRPGIEILKEEPKLTQAGEDINFEPAPYILNVLEKQEDGDVVHRWGNGEGRFIFDGHQGLVIPEGKQHGTY